jgi:hypothetical protein
LKKAFCIASLFLLLFAVTANAGEFDWVVGASIGNISSVDSPALIFNAYGGQSLLLAGLPMTYSSTEGYCGLAPFTSSGSVIASGYSSDFIFATAPFDDLYMFLCVKSSGLSGDLMLVAADTYTLNVSSTASAKSTKKEVPQELKDRLVQEIAKVRGK